MTKLIGLILVAVCSFVAGKAWGLPNRGAAGRYVRQPLWERGFIAVLFALALIGVGLVIVGCGPKPLPSADAEIPSSELFMRPDGIVESHTTTPRGTTATYLLP